MNIITTLPQLKIAIEEISRASIIAYDLETTGLSPHYDKILLTAISTPDQDYVIDFTYLSIEHFQLLKPILEDKNILKLGFNLVFDYKLTYGNTKVEIAGMFDCMLAEQLLTAGLYVERYKGSQFSLAAVSYRRLGIERNKEIRNSFIGYTGIGFIEEAYQYAADDTRTLFTIYRQQLKEIKEKGLERICDLEMQLIPISSMMEYTGVLVNREQLQSLVEPFERYVKACYRALQDVFIKSGAANQILFTKDGYMAINPSSKPQMLEALKSVGIELENLKAKTVVKWDFKHSKRQEAVAYTDFVDDEDVAEALEKYGGLDNPYLRMYTFLTGAEKLLNSYIHGPLERIDNKTGRLYGWYKQLGARSTGRYSSNMQQFPQNQKLHRLGLPYSIRECFIAPKGRVLIIADFSAIEMVILADRSGDQKLAHEHMNGDIHIVVAHTAMGKFFPIALELHKKNKEDQPYKSIRQGSKRVSYGIAYGIQGKSLAEQMTIDLSGVNIKVSPEQADAMIKLWKTEAFPDAGKFLDACAKQAVTQGYTESSWGRKRFWDLDRLALDKWKYLAAQREGSNQSIQSTSADMTKLAMLYCYQKLDKTKARIIISVHDEIVLESTERYAETAKQILKESMEQAGRDILPVLGHTVIVNPAISLKYDK